MRNNKSCFEFCSIFSIKSGDCSEDCKFCGQSKIVSKSKSNKESSIVSLMEQVLDEASYNSHMGIARFSLVASGRKQSQKEIDDLSKIYKALKSKVDIGLCASLGLISFGDALKLKDAGVERYHCNIETSKRLFPTICTTHTYDEKIATLRAAKKAGLSLCSGCIIGMGESMEDRIEISRELRDLNVESCPINILIPIKNSPLENQPILSSDEIIESLKVMGKIIGYDKVRLAGGRALLPKNGEEVFGKFVSSAISGRLLTTDGNQVEEDLKIIERLNLCI